MSSFAVEALKGALAKAENQRDQALHERDEARQVAIALKSAGEGGVDWKTALGDKRDILKLEWLHTEDNQ